MVATTGTDTTTASGGASPTLRLVMGRTAAGIGAGAVTAGLFVLMAALIREEFQPEDTLELAQYEINPRVDDIVVQTRTITMSKMPKLDIPPPPPVVDIPATQKPSEPVVTLGGDKPIFKVKTMRFETPEIVESDRNAQPIMRIPPQMPPRADRSGHCMMRFNVSADRQPYDVQATSCSQPLFSGASVRAVQNWRYRPKIRDGQPRPYLGVETRISFQLTDERGRVIPE